MTLPAPENLTLYRGNSFSVLLEIHARNSDGTVGAAVDLTDYTTLAQIRSAPDSPVIATLTVVIDADQVTNRGQLTLSLDHATSKDLPPSTVAPYVWDLETVDPDGNYDTPIGGEFTVIADVSHA